MVLRWTCETAWVVLGILVVMWVGLRLWLQQAATHPEE